MYTQSDFSSVSPMNVSSADFIKGQADLTWHSFFSLQMIFIEQGAFFFVNAVLLYTAIFFLVSIMNDLVQHNNQMYVEGSSALETEKKQLKIVLGLFGASYLVRCAFDILVGFYLIEVTSFCEEYPGFFELSQSLYFFLSDVMPIMALYRMHHQVYGD